MNDEPNLIDLFPTPLYVATDVLTEEENQELIDHIIATQDKQVGKEKIVGILEKQVLRILLE